MRGLLSYGNWSCISAFTISSVHLALVHCRSWGGPGISLQTRERTCSVILSFHDWQRETKYREAEEDPQFFK